MAADNPNHKNEFQVDINPANSRYAIGVSNSGGGVSYYTTSDYGQHWATSLAPTPADASMCCDAGIAYANDDLNKAYMVYLAFSGAARRAYVLRTDDNGQTWSGPFLAADQDGLDRTTIAVDNGLNSPRRGWVYVAYHATATTPGTLRFQIYGVYSSDKGQTWSLPFPISKDPPENESQSTPQLRVASDGTLYVGYQEYTDKYKWCSAPGYPPIQNMVARLTSFSPGPSPIPTFTQAGVTIIQGGVCAPQGTNWERPYFCSVANTTVIRSFSHPILSFDPTNPSIVYMVYSGGDLELPYSCGNPVRNGYHSDTLFRKSTDKGATWTAPIKINGFPYGGDPPGYDQYMPWMDVTPNGKIWVGWQDRRIDIGATNTKSKWYQAYSTDQGVTWNDFAVADDTTSALSGIGDYHGLAAKDDLVLGMWYATQFHPYGDPLTDPNPPFHPFQANDEKSKR